MHADVHPPLSQQLADVLAESRASGNVTLNGLLLRIDRRTLYLVMIILCLPFVLPVSVPGLSPIMGTIIALLSLRLASGRQPRLPGRLGERHLPPQVQQRLLSGSSRFLRLIEKVVRPRRTQWLIAPPARLFNSCLIALLALLLALPLPAPPFFLTNSVPSYGIIVLAASLMEEDGVLIWFGYALVVVNIVFFAFIASLASDFLLNALLSLRDALWLP